MSATTADTEHGQFIEANGLRFHYRVLGRPDAPPVLFLHGIMGHSYEWDVLLADLATGYRVVALDQRGHGLTQWAESYTPADMAADIPPVLDALGLQRPHLVGHSMGAIVSMLTAARHPERVDRVALIDIAPESLDATDSWGPEMLLATLKAFSTASYPTVQAAVDEWLAGDPLAHEPLLRNYVEHALERAADGTWTYRFDAAGLGQFVRGADPQTLRAALARIEAPALLVRGRNSEVVPPDAASGVLRLLRNSSYAEIPEGSHDLGVQQPEAVAAAVRAFLDA